MADSGTTAKRPSYASKACTNCRRRKARCSGTQPCASCTRFKEECTFAPERDGRKSTSAAYVSALEARIAQLEGGGGPGPSTLALAPTSSSLAELEARNQALRTRILTFERALTSRGISISQVLEDEGAAPDVEPPPRPPAKAPLSGRPVPIQPSRRKSILGKRTSGWDEPGSYEDDELSWVEGMRDLRLSDASHSLLYHGPSSVLAHSENADQASSLPSAPISASVDYAPSPLCTPAAARPDPLDFFSAPSAASDIDWDRNLPRDLGIDRETHDTILDLFESFFAPWCVVVDMRKFRRDMHACLALSSSSTGATPTRTDFYSPMLHSAILALGCFLHKGPRMRPFPPINLDSATLKLYPSGPSTFFKDQADLSRIATADLAAIALYNHAKAMFELECEAPLLSTVRGLLFIASFNSAIARLNLGYLYFGTAVRCAASLGVDINSQRLVEQGVITDQLWSLATGRFLTIRVDDQEISLPEPDSAADAAPWPVPAGWDIGEGIDPSQMSANFIATAKLALVQSELITKIYASKAELTTAELLNIISDIDVRLEAWAAELPSSLIVGQYLAGPPPPHVITLQLSQEKTRMLLHRPLFHRAGEPGAETSIKHCLAAANRVIQLCNLYESLYGLCYGPLTTIQTVFIAGTVHLLTARRSMRAPKRLKASLDGAEACVCPFLGLFNLVRKWTASDGGAATPIAKTSGKSVSPPAAAAPYLPPPTLHPFAPSPFPSSTFPQPSQPTPLASTSPAANAPAFDPFYFPTSDNTFAASFYGANEQGVASAPAPAGSSDFVFNFAAMLGMAGGNARTPQQEDGAAGAVGDAGLAGLQDFGFDDFEAGLGDTSWLLGGLADTTGQNGAAPIQYSL
ncbi:hypothetical protein Rhopal_007239-T1 [Rhodotorula paludigena]|uniref:Zn(2)-C6 fungal-type domain-containing protein n=1 Tax=Rhodotorula paludigena TaxID=86838 RepID=A0AAV5GW38_9BASI|nr:hypothetical protein Rhopal_007239-T1 [Rhodotorula paludigena]